MGYVAQRYQEATRNVTLSGGTRLTPPERATLLPMIHILAELPSRLTHIVIHVVDSLPLTLYRVGWPDQNDWQERARLDGLTLPDEDLTKRAAALFRLRKEVVIAEMPTTSPQGWGDQAAMKAARGRERPADVAFEAGKEWILDYLSKRRRHERELRIEHPSFLNQPEDAVSQNTSPLD